MGHSVPPPGFPAATGWDVEFTRIAREVQGRVRMLVQVLTARFVAAGLDCDVQTRQTPRGLSTFLALVGQRGLLCMVDVTLIDGMAGAREPGAALDIRLLDACGDPAARCSPRLKNGASAYQATSDDIFAIVQVAEFATAIHLLVMGVFGLPSAESGGNAHAVS
jgi:hypothetical protein